MLRLRSAYPLSVLLLAVSVPAHAQITANPSLFYVGNPTARSWGMGFTDVASMAGSPSASSPATLGMFAMLSPGIEQMHNWERLPDGSATEINFGNDMQRVTWALWSGKPLQRAPQVGFGVVHQTGWYTWNSPSENQRPNMEFGRWAFGFGVNLGFDLAFGFAYRQDKRTYLLTNGTSRSYESDWLSEGSAGARLRLNNWAQRWGVIDEPFQVYGFIPEIFWGGMVSSGEYSYDSDKGMTFGVSVDHRDGPLIAFERVIDYLYDYDHRDGCKPADQQAEGWELTLAGSVAIRSGKRWTYYNHEWCSPSYRWSTHGYAIDFGGAQRWMRALLNIETSPTLGWVLDRIEMRYEAASFGDTEDRPLGLGEASIRQWSIGLADVGWY